MGLTLIDELLALSGLVSVVVLGFWIYWAYKCKHLAYYAVPVILLLTNEIIFDITRILAPNVLTSFFTMWSLGIRIQALLTLLAGIIIMLRGKIGYGCK